MGGLGADGLSTPIARSMSLLEFLKSHNLANEDCFGAVVSPVVLPLLVAGSSPVVLWNRPRSRGATARVIEQIWERILPTTDDVALAQYDKPLALTSDEVLERCAQSSDDVRAWAKVIIDHRPDDLHKIMSLLQWLDQSTLYVMPSSKHALRVQQPQSWRIICNTM